MNLFYIGVTKHVCGGIIKQFPFSLHEEEYLRKSIDGVIL